MRFLPYENFYVVTKLTAQEIQVRLQQGVSDSDGSFFKNFFAKSGDKYFEGSVTSKQFELQPNINYRNSFLPQIKGLIQPNAGGSKVHVKMNLHVGVIVFISIWLSFAGLAGIAFLLNDIDKGNWGFADFIPFIMFLVAYGMAMGGFKYESIEAKKQLVFMLGGYVELNN